ncbi:MAG: PQQ-dependent sugar dehydrogenase [Chitinophagaceae bacterium]
MKTGLKILLIVATAGLLSYGLAIPKSDKTVDGPLTLPAGFTSSVMAENTGRARHIAVNTNGDLFIKLSKLKDGKGIIRLRDTNGDGKADDSLLFGNFAGTGITIKNGYLYASSDEDIYRFELNSKGDVVNPDKPDLIVSGLFRKGGHHSSKSIALDNTGNIYVNIGAPSNICQEDASKAGPGMNPCPLLEMSGGIWQFKADKLNQKQGDGVRYATGLRNIVGLDWNNEVNELYVMQHGRDMLFQFYPQWYDEKAGAENPAEEMFRVRKGGDYGWPYCYYDNEMKQKLLNPEYGGDRKTVGLCEGKDKSILQFPGHMAPNGLLFYTGNQFPAKYKNGAFIAFHGSWNRAPQPQAGYFVVFVPFKNGVPTGKWEIFADGFAGENINRAKYRPCGLSQGPDGALYVSDDNSGNIWKISYGK